MDPKDRRWKTSRTAMLADSHPVGKAVLEAAEKDMHQKYPDAGFEGHEDESKESRDDGAMYQAWFEGGFERAEDVGEDLDKLIKRIGKIEPKRLSRWIPAARELQTAYVQAQKALREAKGAVDGLEMAYRGGQDGIQTFLESTEDD